MAINEKIKRVGKQRSTLSRGKLFPLLVFASLLSLAVFSFAASFILSLTENPAVLIGAASLGVTVVSACAVSCIISKKCDSRGVSLSVLVAFATVLVLLSVSLIMTKGAPSGGAIINYACYVAVSALTAFIAMPREKKHRHKRY